MAVPNTNTFSLNDVRVELGLGTTASLSACFAAAVESQFDDTYKGAKDRLSNFRNYGAFVPTLTVSPTSRRVSSSSGSFTVTVTSNTQWTVSESLSWVSISGASGINNDTFTVNYTTNSITQSRSGTITVTIVGGGQSATISITQSAATGQTTYQVQLGYGTSQSSACGFAITNPDYYYLTGSSNLLNATGVYFNAPGTTKAPSGYYSDGGSFRYWNGNAFSGPAGLCII
ncbi:BACON domain-containing protein [Muricauda oceani]|uniref:BACON domain-containing protein n=1 Tax=Flagellimonas oceani TaxID=2698672 RepID=A0A6G7J5Y3_9FLAO|nr:BACON domain-containing protein [Allomuricauda oceani]MBW8242513.1 BACON domain-containing protein [Allomuricauda oceani]QII46273.1 BACON domain-containing protein [Allomuricauda oceani]